MKTRLSLLAVLLVLTGCVFADGSADGLAVTGADVSWVPALESQGYYWLNKAGVRTDLLEILKKDYQMNTIRLRVFVNPSRDLGNGWCDTAATVAMARRAKAAGLEVMVDFHYSDTWADPGHQTPPAAWKDYTVAQTSQAVYDFTNEVMTQLKNAGITPTYAQVGNETNDGMLWPLGRASTSATTMGQYAQFVTSGYNAVKAVSSETRVIVHLGNGDQSGLYTWNIGGLVSNGAKFDVVGLSLYPSANGTVAELAATLKTLETLVSTYHKPVMMVECGMRFSEAASAKLFIARLIANVRTLGSNGLGVLYWEPEAPAGWNGYGLGAWSANGKASAALDAFIGQ